MLRLPTSQAQKNMATRARPWHPALREGVWDVTQTESSECRGQMEKAALRHAYCDESIELISKLRLPTSQAQKNMATRARPWHPALREGVWDVTQTESPESRGLMGKAALRHVCDESRFPKAMETRRVSEDEPAPSSLTRRISIE